MAAEQILQGLSEDFLQCSICISRYQNPLMLPCLHSFCSGCLEKWKTATGEQPLYCPTCRRHVELPNKGLKGLPINFLLTSLMERLDLVGRLSEGKSANCDFCRNMTSVLYCMDCQLHVCVTCQVGHSRIPGAREHVVVASDKVSDVTYLKNMTSKKPPSCTDHLQEKLKFYCRTCSKLICRDCTILSHQRHKCCEAEQMVTTTKDSLEYHLKEGQGLIKNLQEKNERIKELRTVVETHMTTMQKQVDDEYDKYIKRLNSRRSELNQELQNLKSEKSDKFKETLSLSTGWFKAIENTQKITEQILEGRNQWEILGNAVDLIKSFSNLKREQETLAQQYKRMETEVKVVTELKFLPSGSLATDGSKFLGTISRNKSSSLFQQSSGIPQPAFSFGRPSSSLFGQSTTLGQFGQFR